MAEVIENKISASGLMNIDLASYAPKQKIFTLDLKDWLWQELIIKEAEFKEQIKNHNWDQYQGEVVAFKSSVEAIIPNWAYMMISANILRANAEALLASRDEAYDFLFLRNIDQADLSEYKDKRVLMNGCSDVEVPSSAYVRLTHRLLPKVKSLMFGEACSNVPIFKAPKTK